MFARSVPGALVQRDFGGWLALGILLLAGLARAPLAVAQPAVPDGLRGWEPWVLHGAEERTCPWLIGLDPSALDARVCGWPGTLVIDAGAGGATFRQRWQLAAESWVPLPGDLERWPEQVTVNGAAAALVARAGLPQLRLAAGTHDISGRIRWSQRPEVLPVPEAVGLISLSIEGRSVSAPERAGSQILLGVRRAASQQDQLRLKVYRLLRDGEPVVLVTRVELEVAGEARELRLPPPLPAGFLPMALHGDLPARVDSDGGLRLQIRAGSYAVELTGRAAGAVAAVTAPKPAAPWPADEVWSVAADDRLRILAIEGAPGIDPAQAGVPGDWGQYPAYALAGGGELRLVERSRGLAAQDANALTLRRELWLDFDRGGFTVLDQLGGTMRQGWRLEMQPPYVVTSARTGDEALLVTDGGGGHTGIEVRTPALEVRAASRLEARGKAPATGWNQRFDSVSGVLHLAPGQRLLAAPGVDAAPGAWFERWHLLDIFLVLLTATAAWRLAGLPLGAIALGALLLTYQEELAPTWPWVNLIIALALARAAPAGLLRRIALGYRLVAFAVLVLALLPFAVSQARLALYPQLEFAGRGDLLAMVLPMEVAAPPAVPSPMMDVAPLREDEAAAEGATREQRSADFAVSSSKVEPIVVTAQQRAVLQRYAPGTLVQTGPGLPAWRYGDYEYRWSGPVEATQTVRFLILPPWAMSLWRVVGLALSALLLAGLARLAFGRLPRLPGLPAWPWPRAGAGAAVLALLLVAMGSPESACAASTPDPQLLSELRQRLLAPPRCAPNCAEILAAQVVAAPDTLTITLEVSALAQVAVPLPSGEPHWQPTAVAVDGTSVGVYRDRGGTRWVGLDRGRHQLRISGALAAVDAIRIPFPLPPRRVDTNGTGWAASGIVERRLASGVLELARAQREAGRDAGRFSGGGEFAPLVRVVRTLRLDLDWSVTTRVERIAPDVGAFTLRVPLLPGEGVLNTGLDTRDGAVLAAFAAGEPQVEWQSSLQRAPELKLVAAVADSRTEVWVFDVSPIWHVEFKGLPAVTPAEPDAATWTFEYYPRGGESLQAVISRPAPAPGPTLAFDGASATDQVGKRSTITELSLTYRSTQGGRHVIRIPADARVTQVMVDDEAVPVRPENGELPLTILPGEHRLTVGWETPTGAGTLTRAAPIDVGTAASNLRTTIALPEDRWILYARGPGVGPAILYWGELVVFLLLAVWLGRSGLTPLGVRDWLLLGLGLSTFSWFALALFAAWVFTLRWREAMPGSWTGRRYNLRQVALGVLTVAALGALLAAVPQGLLATPDMRIEQVDPGSPGLHWFVDRTVSALPQPFVISVSLWWYKLAMLLWALWLSFAVTHWVKWAWGVFVRDGLWQARAAGQPAGGS